MGMFSDSCFCVADGVREFAGHDLIARYEQYYSDDDCGYSCAGACRMFHFTRYLEYFSLQAPKGEEGMYLGFSHLHSFLSSIFGFGLAGNFAH